MSGAWDEVRSAIASKLDASTGCATAGLRRATTAVDDPLTMTPEARILQPTYNLMWQTGVAEEYTLDVPFEVVVSRPAGLKRSNVVAATIARAIQVEFQSGFLLALAYVIDARLVSMEPGLTEYADILDANGEPTFDGYRGVIQVHVRESVTRTS